MPALKSGRHLKLVRLAAFAVIVIAFCGGSFLLHKFQVSRNSGALLQRADAAAEQGQWADAAKLYQSYLNFRPKDAEAVLRYAAALEELVKTKPAAITELLKVYDSLLRDEPTRTEARKKAIVHHLSVGSYNSARQHLDYLLTAPEAGPPTSEIYEQLAQCDEKERKYPQAVDHYERAIKLGKADPESYLHLAMILKNEIQTSESQERSEEVINSVVAAYPHEVKARIARAKYRVRTGEPGKARDDVNFAYRSLAGGTSHPEVALALAELAANDLELATARNALDAALKEKPDDNRLPLAMARVLVRLNNPKAAINRLVATANTAVKPDLTLVRIGEDLLNLGDSITALIIAEKFAAEPGMKFFADYLTARAKLAQGNWPEALALFQTAKRGDLKRYPEQMLNAILAEAECHAFAKNPDQRLKSFEEALLVDPTYLPAKVGRAESLAETGKADLAKKAYFPLVAQTPVARLGYCQLLFEDYLADPSPSRRTLLDESFGPTPYTIEVALLKGRFLIAQGKTPDALAFYAELVRSAPDAPAPRVAVAMTRARLNAAAGLAVLVQAEKDLGDRAEFRIARAQLMVRSPNPDFAAVNALGQNVGGLNQRDRYRFLAELGDLLGVVGRWKEAIDLLIRAAAEMPYDVNTRSAVFWLAMETKDVPLQDKMLGELQAIEGADGPYRTVTEATRAIREIRPSDKVRIEAQRAQLRKVSERRATWGRVYALLGDLDMLDGNPEAAADRYREAVRYGGQSESVVRTLVRLLLERNGQAESLEILNRFARTAALPGDLAAQLIRLKGQFGEDSERTLVWARSAEAQKAPNYKDHLIRAGIFASAGFPDEATFALRKAVGLDPDGTAHDAWVLLVQFLAAAQKIDDAKAAVVEATKRLKPASEAPADKAALLVALADCHEFTGDSKASRALYRRAVELAPTDRLAASRYAQVLTAAGQRPEAESLLGRLIASSAPADVKRWARRTLAFSKVSGPDGYSELGAALALVEENLREGTNLADDERAKALILAIDPYKQEEAIQLLFESRKRSPLSPDQNFHLARMYVQQGKLEDAESTLKEATRATMIANPTHLALLVRVQLLQKKVNEARTTVNRLKAAAPNGWDAISAEARVLVAEGKSLEAGRKVVVGTEAVDPQLLASVVGPFLEEIGCGAEAEAVYQKFALVPSPTAHAPLGSWYNRSGQAAKSVANAYAHEAAAPVGVTARLLAGAARCRPRSSVPAVERAEWEKALEKIDDWMKKAAAANPKNPEVLFAKAELDDLFERFEAEIATYREALLLDPNNDIYLNNLATVLAVAKKDGSETTLRYVEKAMLRRGPRPGYLDTQALVHIAGNRFELAVRDLTTAIGLDPRPVFFYHRAVARHRMIELQPELAKVRNDDWAEAQKRGFAIAMLHPAELDEFKRFLAEVGVK